MSHKNLLSQKYCARTGEVHCKCNEENKIKPIVALQVNLQMTCRKLFTDHAVYTALVMKSLVSKLPDVEVLLPRLLENQVDIGDQLKPIIGQDRGDAMSKALTQHINLAAKVIKGAISKSKKLDEYLEELYSNGDQIAEFLTSLNPEKLPYEATQPMFRMHNQYVVDMTIARINENYEEEVKLYDAYYNEILEMSDAISNALI